MSVGDSIRKNLDFWHWYPQLICEGLTEEQLHWQPEAHPNHMMFAMWHAYRSEDDIIHGVLMGQAPVFATEGWAERLPVANPGKPPIGTGLDREGIAAVHLELPNIFAYADAVRGSIQAYADGLSDAEGLEPISLPFFADVYPGYETLTRAEVLTFFCIGHTAEHLGEVQYIKGLLGLKGAPL